METNSSGSLLTAASDASFARWPDSEPFLRRARFGSSGINSSSALKGGGTHGRHRERAGGSTHGGAFISIYLYVRAIRVTDGMFCFIHRSRVCEFFGKQQLRETVEAFRV